VLAMNVSLSFFEPAELTCVDWTILDQVAVAALETGDDAIAEVTLCWNEVNYRIVFRNSLPNFQEHHVHMPS